MTQQRSLFAAMEDAPNGGNDLQATCLMVTCPACSCDAEHAHDRQGIYSCSRCGWKFVMRDGQPQNLLTFRTRRPQR